MIVFFMLLYSATGDSINGTDECGKTKGCFFAPPLCDRSGNVCTSVFTWTIENNKMHFTIEGKIVGRYDSEGRNNYAAVAFSLDEYMGEDMVFICVGGFQKKALTVLGWNDNNRNYLLPDITSMVLVTYSTNLTNDRIRCEGVYLFNAYNTIPSNAHRELMYDLSRTDMEWHILFARGQADSYTDVLFPHSLIDGEGFPWITKDTIRFCTSSLHCNDSSVYKYMSDLHQSAISRSVKYGASVGHGVTMVVCWWILVSSGILVARYAKKYQMKLLGADIWFQIHRFLMSIAFIFITIAYFIIFWQADFRFVECTIACTTDEYSKQLHAIIGTIIYGLLVLQILSGIFRPSIVHPLRPIFNWLHTLNGFGIWAGASTNCVLAITIDKTGLGDNYAKVPNHVMMITILVFCFTIAACEWFANSTRWHPPHPDAVKKLNEEEKNPDDEPSLFATILIFFNASCGIAAACILGFMLMKIMDAALNPTTTV